MQKKKNKNNLYLTYFLVDGNWSEWTDWQGSCSQAPSSSSAECAVLIGQIAMTRGSPDAVKRLMPRQRRTRACNNPAPLNDGVSCNGLDEEFRLCKHNCRLNGIFLII